VLHLILRFTFSLWTFYSYEFKDFKYIKIIISFKKS